MNLPYQTTPLHCPKFTFQNRCCHPFLSFALIYAFFCFLTLALPPSIQASEENFPEMTGSAFAPTWVVGEQRLLFFPGLEKYTLSGPSLQSLNPKYLEKHALLKGAKPSEFLVLRADRPGNNSLVLFFRSGATEVRSIQVSSAGSNSPLGTAKHLMENTLGKNAFPSLLKALQEVQIFATPSGFQLVGTVYTFDEARRIRQLLAAFSKNIIVSIKIDNALLERSFLLLKHQVENTPALKSIVVERFGNEVWARGAVASPVERQKIETLLYDFFPLVRLDLRSFDTEATVLHFRIYLLELHYHSFQEFGVKPPGEVTIPLKAFPWGTRESIQLDLQLRALETKGNAKILSQPELVVRAPGEAELFAGGELPIRFRSGQQIRVDWKPFGLTLKLQVKQFTGQEVRVDIFSEVSQIDASNTVDQIPALQSNRMRTQVDAKIGAPLFLSGLLQQKQFKNREGLPLLSSIPVLGSLFSSKAFKENRSELVAILIPSLSPPKSRSPIGLKSGSFPLPRIPQVVDQAASADNLNPDSTDDVTEEGAGEGTGEKNLLTLPDLKF